MEKAGPLAQMELAWSLARIPHIYFHGMSIGIITTTTTLDNPPPKITKLKEINLSVRGLSTITLVL
jgi:hypothetical protein